jgi:tRNA-binding protein
MKEEITFEDFSKVDIRIGTIINVEDFPQARKPAYKLTIDFGVIGIKKSSAQITELYTKENLINKKIVAIINFKKKQIANFFSECLVLGIANSKNEIVLLQSTSKKIINGEQVS